MLVIADSISSESGIIFTENALFDVNGLLKVIGCWSSALIIESAIKCSGQPVLGTILEVISSAERLLDFLIFLNRLNRAFATIENVVTIPLTKSGSAATYAFCSWIRRTCAGLSQTVILVSRIESVTVNYLGAVSRSREEQTK